MSDSQTNTGNGDGMDRPVRVLHLITKLAVGGAQMNTLISTRDIDEMGYPSEILSGPERPEEGDLFDLAEGWGVNVSIAPHLKRNISPIADILAFFEIRRFIRNGSYDIVHTHGSKAHILGRLAAIGSPGTRVIQTAHGWPFWDTQNPLVRKLYVTIEKWGFYRADAFVVVSRRDAEKAVKHGIGTMKDHRLIRSGVEFGPFLESRGTCAEARDYLGLDPDRPVVGTVMRFCTEKAPEVFVRVASSVISRKPEVMFVLVGDGPLYRETQETVASLGLESNFLFLGSRTDVDRILPAFDIFLITSRTEGLPRTLLESLAAGIPTVATDVGGISELVGDGRNGILCPQGDVKCLVEGVMSILDDPALATRLMRHVDRDLEPFSAGRMVQMLFDLYTDVVRRRMNVVFLCDDEPLHIPGTLLSVIRSRPFNNYTLVALPGHGSVRNPLQNLKRYFGLYGPIRFPLQLLRFLGLKLVGLLNLPSRRPHSIAQVARRSRATSARHSDINSPEALDYLQSVDPDLILSLACPQILKKSVLGIPSRGAWNIHSALLPLNRGMLPTFWSLYKGDRPGVTMHRMVRKLDAGEILLQKPVDASIHDTSLHELLSLSKSLAADIISEGMDILEDGRAALLPNPESEASFNFFPTPEEVGDFRWRGGVVTGKRKPRYDLGLSFDMEEWFQTAAARSCFPYEVWDEMATEMASITDIILDVLRKFNSRATFFVLGWVIERFPNEVLKIAAEGHEIASHGYSHQELTSMNRKTFGDELDSFGKLIDSLSLPPPRGFRAPGFSLIPETTWAVDELVTRGYSYDSSVFPMFRHRYGVPGAPLDPFILAGESSSIQELPMTSISTFAGKVPIAGGAYMRFLPGSLHRMLLRHISRMGRTPILYIHPWELYSRNISGEMSRTQRLRQHHNTGDRMLSRLCAILRNFRGIALCELADSVKDSPTNTLLDIRSEPRRRKKA